MKTIKSCKMFLRGFFFCFEMVQKENKASMTNFQWRSRRKYPSRCYQTDSGVIPCLREIKADSIRYTLSARAEDRYSKESGLRSEVKTLHCHPARCAARGISEESKSWGKWPLTKIKRRIRGARHDARRFRTEPSVPGIKRPFCFCGFKLHTFELSSGVTPQNLFINIYGPRWKYADSTDCTERGRPKN